MRLLTGGPGSSKTERMDEIAKIHPTWRLISVGKSLFRYLEGLRRNGLGEGGSHGGDESTANMVRNLVRKGDMVPQVMMAGASLPATGSRERPFQGTVLDLVMEEMSQHADVEGFFITGFPKDIIQAQGFEERVDFAKSITTSAEA